MKYCTLMSADVMTRHYEIDTQKMIDAFGMVASKSHTKGDTRTLGNHSEYKDNQCRFVVAENLDVDPEEMIDLCLKPITLILQTLDGFIRSGGTIWIILKLHDPSFVQLNLERKVISKLADVGVELAIENHCS